jgi:type III restriction enzyme
MLPDIDKAKIVITNYQAFKPRETLEISKTGRSLLQGRDAPPDTIENDGQMLHRVANDLMGFKGIVVLNDEAHRCYREKHDSDEEVTADEREEAKRNAEAARLWISGLEATKRKLGITTLFDLSATPFFLRGSGYREGTLFPWTVSDFSLMDAIECGIVKLPRIPVADNSVNADTPIYRNLWDHIGKKMPKTGRGKSGKGNPLALPILAREGELRVAPVPRNRAFLSGRLCPARKTAPEGADAGTPPARPPGQRERSRS